MLRANGILQEYCKCDHVRFSELGKTKFKMIFMNNCKVRNQPITSIEESELDQDEAMENEEESGTSTELLNHLRSVKRSYNEFEDLSPAAKRIVMDRASNKKPNLMQMTPAVIKECHKFL